MPELNIGALTVILGEQPKGRPMAPSAGTTATLSISEARQAASFDFKVPTSPGAGLSQRELVHIKADAELVVMTYARTDRPGGEPGWFTVIQGPLSQYQEKGRAAYLVVGDHIEPTEVSGMSAAFASMSGSSPQFPPLKHLIWTDGRVVQHIVGDGLHGVDLEGVAASLA